jgi:hypothetical protein
LPDRKMIRSSTVVRKMLPAKYSCYNYLRGNALMIIFDWPIKCN